MLQHSPKLHGATVIISIYSPFAPPTVTPQAPPTMTSSAADGTYSADIGVHVDAETLDVKHSWSEEHLFLVMKQTQSPNQWF